MSLPNFPSLIHVCVYIYTQVTHELNVLLATKMDGLGNMTYCLVVIIPPPCRRRCYDVNLPPTLLDVCLFGREKVNWDMYGLPTWVDCSTFLGIFYLSRIYTEDRTREARNCRPIRVVERFEVVLSRDRFSNGSNSSLLVALLCSLSHYRTLKTLGPIQNT